MAIGGEIIMAEFEGSRIFLNIPVQVAYDPRIKSEKSILLYGEIRSMTNVTGKFFMSNSKLAKRLRCSRRTIINCINELESLKYIKTKIIKDGKIIKGREIYCTSLVHPSSLTQCNGVHSPSEADCTLIEQDNRTTKRTKDIYSDTGAKRHESHHIPYKEIVDYLNKKAGTKYKATSKATQNMIKARFSEKYTLDDFKKVIDNQAFAWQGTNYWKYMRPSTLFRASKFEGYLNSNALNKEKEEPHGGYTGLAPDVDDIPDEQLPF